MVTLGSRIPRRDFDTVQDAFGPSGVDASDYFGTGESLLPGHGYVAVQFPSGGCFRSLKRSASLTEA